MEIEKIAKSYLPILISGETGSGKTQLARKIHQVSPLRDLRYIRINIASIPTHLFDSILFGHEKGSFTGAIKKNIGFCEEVNMGTLFFDEIADLNPENQLKILTLLDEGIYYSIGSTQAKKFKGRIIFATNKDLKKLVHMGQFREDLYYRIRLWEVSLRAIRDEENYKYIIEKMIKKNKISIEKVALNKILEYNWPGNYRELNNTLLYLAALDKQIKVEDLPGWVSNNDKNYASSKGYKQALEEFEKKYLQRHLKLNNGMLNRTANSINLNKVTLISKLKKYDINRNYYKKAA